MYPLRYKSIPKYFHSLPIDDQSYYLYMKRLIGAYISNKAPINFYNLFSLVKHYIYRSDQSELYRMNVCGIIFNEDQIYVNFNQLRFLINKSKSYLTNFFLKNNFHYCPKQDSISQAKFTPFDSKGWRLFLKS